MLQKTQREFAACVGCTAATLSAYENGSKSPSLEIVKNIAKSCGVSIDWLCGLTDKKSYKEEIKTYSDIIKLIVRIYGTNADGNQICHIYHEEQSETPGTFPDAALKSVHSSG